MSINKNIGKALFQVEKLALIIVSLVIIINLSVNTLVVFLDQSTTGERLIEQMLLNITLFGFVYIMIYGINQTLTSIPLLVSLNCPKRLLAKNMITKGVSRSLIVTLIFFLLKILFFRFNHELISVFGLNFTSSSLINNLIFATIIYILLHLTYSLVTFISILGTRFGWEYIVTAILFTLGIVFIMIKPIVLLLMFGWHLNIFLFLTLLIIIGLNFINFQLIKKYEFKN